MSLDIITPRSENFASLLASQWSAFSEALSNLISRISKAVLSILDSSTPTKPAPSLAGRVTKPAESFPPSPGKGKEYSVGQELTIHGITYRVDRLNWDRKDEPIIRPVTDEKRYEVANPGFSAALPRGWVEKTQLIKGVIHPDYILKEGDWYKIKGYDELRRPIYWRPAPSQ